MIEDYTKQYDQYLEGNLDKITPISPEEIEHLHQIELKQQLSTNKEQEKKNEEEMFKQFKKHSKEVVTNKQTSSSPIQSSKSASSEENNNMSDEISSSNNNNENSNKTENKIENNNNKNKNNNKNNNYPSISSEEEQFLKSKFKGIMNKKVNKMNFDYPKKKKIVYAPPSTEDSSTEKSDLEDLKNLLGGDQGKKNKINFEKNFKLKLKLQVVCL